MGRWVNPTAIMHVPPGGEFLSMVANGAPRALPHSGVDHSRWEGNDVVSIGDGVVLFVGSGSAGWGNYIYIDHGPDGGEPDGPNVPHIISFYAHLNAMPPFSVGDRVSAGTVLAGIGRSGVAFAHLHWGMAVCTLAQARSTLKAMGAAARGLLIDPLAFLAQYGSKPATPKLPNERVIAPGGARRREEPTTEGDNYDPSENLAGGAVVAFDGFVRSTLPKGQPGGEEVWLKIGSLFVSYTTVVPLPSGLAGIRDLGTYPAVTPPVAEPEPANPDPVEPDPVDPTPEPPAEPDPEEEAPVTIKKPLSAAQLAKLVRDAEKAGVKFATSPDQPIIPDRVARPLWVILGAVAVSVGPAAALTVLEWGAWDAEVASQFSTIVGAWVGALAAVLGLSRFAKTK